MNTTWTDGMTKLMLEKYAQWINYMGSMKKFRKKLKCGNEYQQILTMNLV